MRELKPRAKVLAVAGLDPSGGAGLAADVRTFMALGVYCAPVVAAITSQDTKGVYRVEAVGGELLRAQLEAVLADLRPGWAKVGVLYSPDNMEVVASLLGGAGVKMVLDPVLSAGTGQPLVGPGGLKALRERLLPEAFIITPNAKEAARLSGLKVRDAEDARRAAKALADLGPEGVIVKGGHIAGDQVVDILYYDGGFYEFRRPRVGPDAHGSGCVFSSALTALLALGRPVLAAVEEAGDLAAGAIRWALSVGSGRPVANPGFRLINEAERYAVLREVEEAVKALLSEPGLAYFVPEVGAQLAMALPMPTGPGDVAAVDGRMVRTMDGVRAVGPVRFGASDHMARVVLTAMRHDPSVRAALNLAYRPSLLEALGEMGLKLASFDRRREPPDVAAVEGASLPWGVEEAIRASGGAVPDVIYDLGGHGKEAMIRILGRSAHEVVEKAVRAIRIVRAPGQPI
ncbi:bifunctional hydroxymethylpyrimidine kinase/phosphomethylpyrimidine kinase [Candidatus Bathyarchaeota archaeon]|nr:MAG: bifunctional hydroxymethylpyrimidine kinase/phosphomethylpyrimidine kinase [Candidatus Bathyarchaeota archaeon]